MDGSTEFEVLETSTASFADTEILSNIETYSKFSVIGIYLIVGLIMGVIFWHYIKN